MSKAPSIYLCVILLTAPLLNAIPAISQDDATKVLGRLTCTAKQTAPGTDIAKEVDCTFGMIDGNSAKYAGTIARHDLERERSVGRRVLIWSVYGPTSSNSTDLGGVYVRREADPRQVLKNGSGNGILLIPPVGRDQLPGNPALTALELNLTATRA